MSIAPRTLGPLVLLSAAFLSLATSPVDGGILILSTERSGDAVLLNASTPTFDIFVDVAGNDALFADGDSVQLTADVTANVICPADVDCIVGGDAGIPEVRKTQQVLRDGVPVGRAQVTLLPIVDETPVIENVRYLPMSGDLGEREIRVHVRFERLDTGPDTVRVQWNAYGAAVLADRTEFADPPNGAEVLVGFVDPPEDFEPVFLDGDGGVLDD